jgi:putative ABC transport system permease protein
MTTLARAPGVDGVALATTLLRGRGSSVLAVEGRPVASPEMAVPDVSQDAVSVDYFRVMRVPLNAGRGFERSDREGSEPVAIVNDALARKYFPDESPVGRRVKYSDAASPWLTIVGVVGNQKGMTVHQEMTWVETPCLFRPVQQTAPRDITLILRSKVEAGSLGATVQRLVAALAPDVPVSDVRTLEDRISHDLAQPRFRALLLGGFAGLALLLAMVGLYSVLSHAVAQRTQEIGIRMALGAPRAAILSLVVRQGALIAGTGLGVGLLAASWLGRFIGAMLYGVPPTDPATLVLVSLSLALAACLATYLPARRALRTNPIEALRHD